MPATVPGPTAGEGWLILKVALPRLARRLDQIDDWLDRYTPERFAEAADGGPAASVGPRDWSCSLPCRPTAAQPPSNWSNSMLRTAHDCVR